MDIANKKIRVLRGKVVSDKMEKTVVISISRLSKHPKYKKYRKITKRFKAHDPENQYRVGDMVVIQESKPLSKEKRWRVVSKTKS